MMKNLKTSSRYVVCICTSLLLILLLSLCLFYTYFPSSSRVSISASCESFSSSSSWKQWKEAQATGCCDMIKELANYANTTNGHHLYSRIRQWWLVTKHFSQIVLVVFFFFNITFKIGIFVNCLFSGNLSTFFFFTLYNSPSNFYGFLQPLFLSGCQYYW